MGYYCTVPQCTSLAGKTKNVKFHRFPRDPSVADKWNDILKRGKPYTKYSKVCSLHFTQADYNVTTMGQWKTLSKDAMPSQNLPKLNPDGTVMVIRKSRTVKYREVKKEDIDDKSDKWEMSTPTHHIQQNMTQDTSMGCTDPNDQTLTYRLQTLNAIANNISPQHQQSRAITLSPQSQHATLIPKAEKQDAIMQTEPVQSEEDDTQPNNSYSEASDKSYTEIEYQMQNYQKEDYASQKKFEAKDYTKCTDDYIPQTNEEYNKEAEKYALERKTHYDKLEYQKGMENGYQKIPELYAGFDKYQRQEYSYPNGYSDSAEMLRNQQHNLQMLQEQHRITENQNFFNESQIKQEIDINLDDDKYLYERTKDQLDSSSMYSESQRRLTQQQRLLEQIQQIKQEPDIVTSVQNILQPQSSPYFQPNGHNNGTGGYYEQLSRPGPELLIAKQNALAAHTQLWQNTMKRPFFYSESPHYNGSQLLHRYEDLTRILQ